MIQLAIGQTMTLSVILPGGAPARRVSWCNWTPAVHLDAHDDGTATVTGRQPGQTTVSAFVGAVASGAPTRPTIPEAVSVDFRVGSAPGLTLAVVPPVTPNSYALPFSPGWFAAMARRVVPTAGA